MQKLQIKPIALMMGFSKEAYNPPMRQQKPRIVRPLQYQAPGRGFAPESERPLGSQYLFNFNYGKNQSNKGILNRKNSIPFSVSTPKNTGEIPNIPGQMEFNFNKKPNTNKGNILDNRGNMWNFGNANSHNTESVGSSIFSGQQTSNPEILNQNNKNIPNQQQQMMQYLNGLIAQRDELNTKIEEIRPGASRDQVDNIGNTLNAAQTGFMHGLRGQTPMRGGGVFDQWRNWRTNRKYDKVQKGLTRQQAQYQNALRRERLQQQMQQMQQMRNNLRTTGFSKNRILTASMGMPSVLLSNL